MSDLALITAKDLSLIESSLNEKQLKVLIGRTPEKYVRTRPAKGGGTWDYVSGGYIKKLLNLTFGFDWDFEITNQMILHDEAIVQGRLTVRSNGKTIVKTQFGNKDVIYRKGTEKPLSIGNDLKSAATDCLKKCAAELGFAADIYNKLDFNDIEITSESKVENIYNDIVELLELKADVIAPEMMLNLKRVIDNKEVRSYNKVFKVLSEL
jgi:recombination DNA repair RAD52 pathway protein